MPLREGEPKDWVFDCPTPEGPISINVRQIDSSNIEWVGWPATKNAQPLLIIQFKGGARYLYAGVTYQRAVALANAESTGVYFSKRIRGKYETLKLR